jgi:hypothetical protein
MGTLIPKLGQELFCRHCCRAFTIRFGPKQNYKILLLPFFVDKLYVNCEQLSHYVLEITSFVGMRLFDTVTSRRSSLE